MVKIYKIKGVYKIGLIKKRAKRDKYKKKPHIKRKHT